MRLLIAGGGTGGHLYPGVAVAEELLSRGSGHTVRFAGSARGIEARVLPGLGFEFSPVRSGGIVGTGVLGKFRAVGSLALGFADASSLVRGYRPHACLGVGGYVSFPVAAYCGLTGVATAVQEQNAKPGIANRTLSRLARRVFLGDEAAAPFFPHRKVRLTGNPLRRAFAAPAPYEPPSRGGPLRVLVLGGSQGARSLNEAAPAALAELPFPFEVRHQAGRGKEEAVRAAYAGRAGATVEPFIEDMASAYAWAQVVIARSGALTLAELAAAGRPAVLVPFPFAAGNHQEANARAAEARGAGRCVLESELSPRRLRDLLVELAGNPEALARMAEASARSARRDAAARIVDELLALAGEGG